jgi:hypothetical protein
MSCECGYADECDGETAIFYPLQDGGMCAARPCQAPRRHEARADCWCEPMIDYKDPDTGVAVYVHNQVQ